MKDPSRKKAFTPSELLILSAVLVLVVAIAIPVFIARLNRAKYQSDLNDVRALYAQTVSQAEAEGNYSGGVLYLDPSILQDADYLIAQVSCDGGLIHISCGAFGAKEEETMDVDIAESFARRPAS